jgi:hypothetical protein
VPLPKVIMTPVPSNEISIAADYEGIEPNADPETAIWSIRKIPAMQRTMPLPQDIGGIGGWAEVMTTSPSGITQRVIERWPEDQIGARLCEQPID